MHIFRPLLVLTLGRPRVDGHKFVDSEIFGATLEFVGVRVGRPGRFLVVQVAVREQLDPWVWHWDGKVEQVQR